MESLPPNDGSIEGSEPTIEGFVTASGMGARSSLNARHVLIAAPLKAQAWCGEA